MNSKLAISFVSLIICAPNAWTESSRDYAVMGANAWNAFSCSHLAFVAEFHEEHKRLFLFGMEQGHAYLDAVKGSKITPQDTTEIVPKDFTLRFNRQSNEFILGTVYEATKTQAKEEYMLVKKDFANQKEFSKARFQDRQCDLLGH